MQTGITRNALSQAAITGQPIKKGPGKGCKVKYHNEEDQQHRLGRNYEAGYTGAQELRRCDRRNVCTFLGMKSQQQTQTDRARRKWSRCFF